MVGFTITHYRIVRKLGSGGMGDVYLAEDIALGRPAALKFLRRRTADSDEDYARFEREAKIVSNLNHPHIATIYEFGRHEDAPFLAMEYLPGGTLGDLIRESRKSGRLLPVEDIVRYTTQMAEALNYAHKRDTIHRDLKPDNVMLTADGRAKVTDFGLAKILSATSESAADVRVGTPAYMSPEQAMGLPLDHRSDIFSFGLVLFELATLQQPFDWTYELSLIYDIVNTPAPLLSSRRSGLPEEVGHIVARALAKNPNDRFAGMEEVLALLSLVGKNEGPALTGAIQGGVSTVTPGAKSAFVGRKVELAHLWAQFEKATLGEGRVVVISGEAGSGKTRTIEVFADRARRSGAYVLMGSCHEAVGAPVFWPWSKIVSSALALPRASSVLDSLGSGAWHLRRLSPGVRESAKGDADETLDPSQARFRLFESVTAFLVKLSEERPLVVVLDDLHWGDEASLRLLTFVSNELRHSRILLIAACRNIPPSRGHPLTSTLGHVARQDHATRIELPGLAPEDVAELIALESGKPPSEEFVNAVLDRTQGNAFFLTEVAKVLSGIEDSGSDQWGASRAHEVPNSVRDAISVRLASLSRECARVLEVAAVVGRNFTTAVLEKLLDLDSSTLLDALDEAEAARLIAAPETSSEAYTFTHAIVRDAIHENLRSNETRSLHRAAGEALEALYGTDEDEIAGDLANHFSRAGTKSDASKAIVYSARAARLASEQLAYEEAGLYFVRAADLMRRHRLGSEAERCDLLNKAGEEFKRAGNGAQARASFQQAADLARRGGLATELAMAALGVWVSPIEASGMIDPLQLELLEEALVLLPQDDSALRCRVLAELSTASFHDLAQRDSMSADALEMARRLGNDQALLAALICRHNALVVTQDLEARSRVADDALRLAQKSGRLEAVLQARFKRIMDYTEMGDTERLKHEIDTYSAASERLRQPRYLWLSKFFRAALACFLGEIETADRLNEESLRLGERAQDPNAHVFYSALVTLLRAFQGRLAEHVPFLEAGVSRYPLLPGNRAVLAYGYMAADRKQACQEQFDIIAKHDFEDLPRDGSFFVVLSALSVLCLYLKEKKRARAVYDLAAPFPGRNIVMGRSGVGAGSIYRTYGYCAEALQDYDDAVEQHRRSLDANIAMKARPFELNARCELARALLLRGRPEDRLEVKRLLAGLEADANSIGLRGAGRLLGPGVLAAFA